MRIFLVFPVFTVLDYLTIHPGAEREDQGVENWLFSYHYTSSQAHASHHFNRYFSRFVEQGKPNLLLDSGAFTAARSGKPVDLQQYIDYLKSTPNIDQVPYVSLDVIAQGAEEQSWANYLRMRKEGINPVPVIHKGAPLKWVDRYAAECDYIAFGGMSTRPDENIVWLDQAWARLANADGSPKVKVHGLGVGGFNRMSSRYPWFSIDASSWAQTAGMGVIFVPRMRDKDGDFVYDRDAVQVLISRDADRRGKLDPSNFYTWPQDRQKHVLDFLDSIDVKLGESLFELRPGRWDGFVRGTHIWRGRANDQGFREVETLVQIGVSNAYWMRQVVNAHYMMQLQKHYSEQPPIDLRRLRSGFGVLM